MGYKQDFTKPFLEDLKKRIPPVYLTGGREK